LILFRKGVGKFYRINQYIQASQVRLIGEDGKQIGIMPTFNAVQEARKLGVDLVEIAPKANPPVCKLINFKKFKYQEAKKEREEKGGQKGGKLKEVWLSPFIAKNDLEFSLRKIREFLKQGNKVRLVIKFTKRQLAHKEFGQQVMEKAIVSLGQEAKLNSEPKWLGKEFFVILNAGQQKHNQDKNKNE